MREEETSEAPATEETVWSPSPEERGSKDQATQCDGTEFSSAMTTRDQEVQTAEASDWEHISNEVVTYVIRVCGLMCQLKASEELYEVGRR